MKGVTRHIMMTEDKMSVFPEMTPVGMAYVPFQQWEEPFPENIALEKGTIFPSLDLPFRGGEADTNDER